MSSGERAVPEALLERFDPHPDRLLDHLRVQVDDEMLVEIAELDCGLHNAPAQFAALEYIRDTGKVQAPMKWEPLEALKLASHGAPGMFSKPNRQELFREHLERAFACSALLRAHVETPNAGHVTNMNLTLAALLESRCLFAAEFERHLGSFVAWRVGQLNGLDDRPFFAFALLLLAVLGRGSEFDEEETASLCRWVLDEEAEEFRYVRSVYRAGYGPSGSWLLGLTNFDLRHRIWRALSQQLKDRASELTNSNLAV